MQTKTVEPLVVVRISCRTSFARAAQLEAAKDMHTINATSGVLFTDRALAESVADRLLFTSGRVRKIGKFVICQRVRVALRVGVVEHYRQE